jgi:hypothetical protein
LTGNWKSLKKMNKSDITVIITTYRRYTHLSKIVDGWQAQCPNVIIANGGKWFNKPGVPQVVYNPDPGNKIRFSAAIISLTDYVLLADDDVMPLPGLVNDFIKWGDKYPDAILGVIGRLMTDPLYWKCPFIRASKLTEPLETAFVGVLYFSHRKYMLMDLSHFKHRALDDLNWQLVEFPNVKKYVIPTKNYQNILELCNDKQSIFKTPESRGVREKFWCKEYKRRKEYNG